LVEAGYTGRLQDGRNRSNDLRTHPAQEPICRYFQKMLDAMSNEKTKEENWNRLTGSRVYLAYVPRGSQPGKLDNMVHRFDRTAMTQCNCSRVGHRGRRIDFAQIGLRYLL